MAAARSSIFTSIFSPATCSQRPRFVVGRRAAPSDVKDNQRRKAARGGEKNIKIKIKRQRAAFDKPMKVGVLLLRRRVTQADVGGTGGSGGGCSGVWMKRTVITAQKGPPAEPSKTLIIMSVNVASSSSLASGQRPYQ